MDMTQNTNTARTVANLTALIRRTTGVVRDNHARALTSHVYLDLVSMLVGASDRYHAAQRAFDDAEAAMINAMDAVSKMLVADSTPNTQHAIESIATTARCYVSALNHGAKSDQVLAREQFIEATGRVTDMMTTVEGRAEVPPLAFAAMSVAMAEETERKTKAAYRSLQAIIQERIVH